LKNVNVLPRRQCWDGHSGQAKRRQGDAKGNRFVGDKDQATTGDARDQQALVASLRDPAAYPHPVADVELLETHISYVLLAGDFAYKLKKPVDLGFLDFTTLDRRRHFCEEEMRLNGRLAPDLYLAVVAITGSAARPTVDGVGDAIEYAVKMRRFDQRDQLDHVLERGALSVERIDELAAGVADFHRTLPVAGADSDYGDPDRVIAPMRENFQHVDAAGERARRDQLARIRAWTEASFADRVALIAARKRQGMVRECHGDMHLANIALYRGRLEIFDGIEFDPALRWIDVISEIAYVTMDLEDRGAPQLGHRLLNRYLEHTGDYPALSLLRFYQVYRAMVRAKVASIRAHQGDVDAAARRAGLAEYQGYADLAERYMRPPRPALLITHGFAGAGKTRLTEPVLAALGAVRLRSDIERRRLAGMKLSERRDAERRLDDPAFSERTYRHLLAQARTLLDAGWPVIVDASFLERTRRERFAELAAHRRLPFLVLDFRADREILRARIRQRAAGDTAASDGGLAVLARQLAQHDPLAPEEAVMSLDSTTAIDPVAIAARLFGEDGPAVPQRA
jgi:aminoglycoside phosphotransferase family enzyme